ncbi:MAG: transglutaminase family protein [Candidatus Methylacidiphilales bacterium]|nr:transglutaminase family protein [Candidatus Methylacidiphilales bacterium]
MSTTHRFLVQARLRYHIQPAGWMLLNMAVAHCGHQRVIRESLLNSAGLPFREQVAPDSRTRFHGVNVPPGAFEVTYEAEVERTEVDFAGSWEPLEASLVDLPVDVARFLYPSRYCESDKLVRLAAKQFGSLVPGHSRVAAICNWIHDRIDYLPGATDEHSSAVDCLISRAGVCRDFAHLGIPARYGSAYVHQLPYPDFHAFFEVWLGDRWWYYDATRLAPQAGFILIGGGHDAGDTSVATMSAGVQFESMEIQVQKLTPIVPAYTASPISFE